MDEIRRLRNAVRDQARPLLAEGRAISEQRRELRRLEQDLRLNEKEIKRTVERLRIAHRALLQAEQKNKAGWAKLLTGAERKSVKLQKHARRLIDQAARRRTGQAPADRSGWFSALKQRVRATLSSRPATAKGSVTIRPDRLTRAELQELLGKAEPHEAAKKGAPGLENKAGRRR